MRIKVVLFLFPLLWFSCLLMPDRFPDWMAARPLHSDFYFGVGTCGKTHNPADARELALERAMLEIYMQAHGQCDYRFEYEEGEDEGSFSMKAQKEGRTIHTISGITVAEESRFPASHRGFQQDTVVVLIKVPVGNIP